MLQLRDNLENELKSLNHLYSNQILKIDDLENNNQIKDEQIMTFDRQLKEALDHNIDLDKINSQKNKIIVE